MDIMRPHLQWIDGICYRINSTEQCQEELAHSSEQEETYYVYDDAECNDDSLPIEEMKDGLYRISVHVPFSFRGLIIGSKGAVRERLKKETKTEIIIPKEKTAGPVGDKKNNVCSACRRIKLIIFSARQRQSFTHFISIPFCTDMVKSRFKIFKQQVMDLCGDSCGIEEKIFMESEKLHLTVQTLVLMDEFDRNIASEALSSCHRKILRPMLESQSGNKLTVRLSGIDYMNDDPSQVDILYAKIKPGPNSDLLLKLCDCLRDCFVSKGLCGKKDDRDLLMHITLMNTKFRNCLPDDYEISRKNLLTTRKETFDARKILENFSDYDFGEVLIESIQISLRFSSSQNEYYHASASVYL